MLSAWINLHMILPYLKSIMRYNNRGLNMLAYHKRIAEFTLWVAYVKVSQCLTEFVLRNPSIFISNFIILCRLLCRFCTRDQAHERLLCVNFFLFRDLANTRQRFIYQFLKTLLRAGLQIIQNQRHA